MPEVPSIRGLIGDDPPSNWGRWGPDDQIGALNHLDAGQVLRGVSEVRTGEVFTLQIRMGNPYPPGDPVWPGRRGIQRRNVIDESSWDGAGGPEMPGGARFADDVARLSLQGTTHYDGLGHVWYDGRLWNGYDSRTTVGALDQASVLPIAERGVVGRGVLIDMARHRGVPHLATGETFDHRDVSAAAEAQGVSIERRDILLIRTGWLAAFYRTGPGGFPEPGLRYSRELVEWFQEREIPNLVTDTMGNEATYQPGTGVALALHCALMRNLGVVMTEMCWLDDLAAACATDGRWSFLYTAAPLKVVGGTGAPVNPVVIR
jgi:kynurenine formamidase